MNQKQTKVTQYKNFSSLVQRIKSVIVFDLQKINNFYFYLWNDNLHMPIVCVFTSFTNLA